MLELRIRSIPGFLALCVLGIVVCVGLSYVVTTAITVLLPILVIGVLLCYFIINMLFYPKAKTIQLLKLSTISLFIFITIVLIAAVICRFVNHSAVVLNSNFTLSMTPAFLAASALFGILSSLVLFKFDKKIKNTEIAINNAGKTTEVSEPVKKAERIEQKEMNPIPVETPVIKAETIKPEPLIEQKIVEEQVLKQDKKEEVQETPTEKLDSLPDIKIEENNQDDTAKDIKNGVVYDESIFDYDDDDIPDNIRLADTKNLKQLESKGIISSIGKLLINNRDIENIIETNELMQQIGCTVEDIDIVSMATGVKIYEKFNKIMVEYTMVKDLTLSNKAGFTIASIINDNRRSETVGAIASSAFLVLKNYLVRLEINNLQKVFFETDESIHTIFKVDEFLLFFTTEKSFEPVNYSLVKDVLSQNTISNQDLSVIKNIKGIEESAITDKQGMLVGSINCENPKKFVSLSSAIFENLKVFITNIHTSKLEKITAFADGKVLTIKKYNDKLAGILTSADGPVKLSDNIAEIEELMK